MSPYAHITGWGMSVPDHVLNNYDLEQMVNTSHDWIVSRTGIHERRIAREDQSTATLATEAALRALEVARIPPADIDLIIVATSSPDFLFPATASLVQDQVGAAKAGAFDLLAACTGFIYALSLATNAIQSGSIRSALVIGAETLSRLVDWTDRNTCVLFGDGAGAFILQAREEKAGLLSAVLRSDGSGSDLLYLLGGGSRHPASFDTIHNKMHYIQMNGREVYRFATRAMAQSTQEAIKKAKLSIEDISLVIPHQANKRIIEAAVRSVNIPMEKCVVNVDRYGNTSTASIPIATCEAILEGRLNPGDHIVFVGFGAGLSWGAAVARWSGTYPRARIAHPPFYRLYARIRSLVKRLLRRVDFWIWGRHNPYI